MSRMIMLIGSWLPLLIVFFSHGLDSDAIHSPNEHYGIFNYLKGIQTIPFFYQYLAEGLIYAKDLLGF